MHVKINAKNKFKDFTSKINNDNVLFHINCRISDPKQSYISSDLRSSC